MAKFYIEFRTVAYAEYEIDADTEDDAIDQAWSLVENDIHDIEWDIDYVEQLDEEGYS